MPTFIACGTRIGVEVGSEREPEIVRWTVWGNGDLQQSFLLLTKDGAVLVDPVEPTSKDALAALRAYAGGSFRAIVNASALHERGVEFFKKRFKVPLYGPQASPPRSKFFKKVDELYDEGDALPGGIEAIGSGDANGEMWLYWQTPRGKRVLINADTIYGQSRRGGLDGATSSYWMQEGGIRLRMSGKISHREMRRRYGKLDEVPIDIILNGHNPLPLDENPKAAIERVLAEGHFENSRGVTFAYMDWDAK